MRRANVVSECSGQALYEALKERIGRGELRPGERLLGLRALQREFDVTYWGAQQAVQRLESEGYLECRRGSGTYIRDREAASRRRGSRVRVRLLVTLTPYAATFLEPLVAAAREELDRLGVRAVPEELPNDEARRVIASGAADACVWVFPSFPFDAPPPEGPAVIVAQDAEPIWAATPPCDIVAADGRQGGALAGRCLREIGCRDVIAVGACSPSSDADPTRPSPWSRLRLLGFEFGWGERIAPDRVLVAQGYSPLAAAWLVPDALQRSPRPDGVFCTSDDLAEGFCHALVAHGIRPGRDVKVVGFDGQPHQFVEDPPLTTVEAPMSDLGRVAARLAVERASEPRARGRRVSLACALRRGETA